MNKKKFFILSSIILVGALGFEPRMVVPKTTALPLGYAPNYNFHISQMAEFI
tara:strand:- start:792 stop:947 length:156 start_codon:yes stop_codon:yes gene_type:complete